jgi:uncharacterized protein DUF1236
MRRNLSITTAAAALLIGTVFAAAQGVQRQAPGGAEPGVQGGAQGQGGAQTAPQDGGKGKAQSKEPRTQGQGGQAQGQGQVAPDPKGKGKDQAQPKEPRTQGQGGQGQRGDQGQRDSQPQQQGQQPKQQPQQGQQTPRDTDKGQKGAEGKGGGAQTGGGVTLNAQQRTTIRTTVLQGSNAPRVSNVNFSINVGTVVPRTGVTLVVVPATLVEIHPAWRGYMYFIVGERIIIVDPNTHAIVAVLDV